MKRVNAESYSNIKKHENLMIRFRAAIAAVIWLMGCTLKKSAESMNYNYVIT